ncbi:RICIN domain-containing protein [Streptomyces sp. NRRL S-350]|uniref:RICIN domain-containing protein n=1 Tax=Streptomyces sp. NRRL S-350 TaxID=1463902 RepID=UPI00068A8D3A|nr:RICIN domain-containing protein [Streptomyces sp. NRRL S-350]
MPHPAPRRARLRAHAHVGLVSVAASALNLLPAGAAHAAGDPVVPGSAYTISSGATGQCLGGRWAATADLTPVVQQPCQGLLGQRWRLTPNGRGGYTVSDRSAPNSCLNVQGGSTAPGAALIEYACNGSPNEQFTLEATANGATLIHPQNSALCLDLPYSAPTPNVQIQQYTCHGGANQQWLLTRADPLLFANPGFEQGTTGWTFTAHAGTAGNNAHRGAGLAYLDAGSGYRISQSTTAPQAGSYDIGAWIATGAAGGTLTVQVNEVAVGTVTLPAQAVYAQYTVPGVRVAAGDTVTVSVGSAPGGWVNVDDVTVAPSAPNNPRISSSNATVTALFDWARAKAESFAAQPGATGPLNADERTSGGSGQDTYATTYWAGYPYRSAFYSRDFAHQVVGAHLLGLDAANKTMLRSFASSAAGAPDHMPYWAVNFDAKTPLSIDYRSPTSFVRELPAAFELAQKINEAYGWTGDTDYLDDPALSGFVAGTVGPYVTGHTGPIDNGGVPVAQATSGDIFQGVASYNENGATLAESGDAVASQYQAYLAAAALATAKGNTDAAAALQAKATTLKTYFNTKWSVDPADPAHVVRAYDVNGTAYSDWGKENSWFIPLKGIMDPGQRQNDYLAWIDAQASGAGAPENLEAATYLPDVFFAHNQGATGWKWMQYVHDRVGALHSTGRFLNGDYPEIACTLLGQTVQGLLGVQPDAAGHALSTTSRLPSDIGWLQLTSIPVGSGTVTLRHDGVTKSTLTNTSGTGSLTWTARFAGTHSGITVDGTAQPTRTVTLDGVTYTYATVTVPARRTSVVEVTG